MQAIAVSPTNIEVPTDADRVTQWLSKFEQALNQGDRTALKALFSNDCHWRDLLAFTWNITPHGGQDAIVERLVATQPQVRAKDFTIARGRTAPRRMKRVGIDSIEAIFAFETATGRGQGLLRLLAAQPDKAWVISTSLQELKGHEPAVYERRPSGAAYSREFGGDNWADRRAKEQAFAESEPAVLIIGAGQSGLSVAARLRLIGVEALCVEQQARVGDTWRQRYHSLALHNQVALNQMAYMPFPPSWPKYLPKDMVANWLEHYALAMECNVWTSSTFTGASYDEAAGHWTARIRRADGSERVMHPRHILFATGIVGAPKPPNEPTLSNFKGQVLHTHGYTDGSAWKGKNALVLGAGTSGHDIAQDLYGHGAKVKMIQRSAITVTSVEAATVAYSLYYDEGIPVEDCDLIATAATFPLALRGMRLSGKRMLELDKELLGGLAARGFKLDTGEDSSYQLKVRRSHSGYYLNCGCSELIVEGKVGLIQHEDIERFVAEGVLMKDGRVEKADLIVTATGYQNQQELVRELLGNAIADKIGPIWGVSAKNGELNNMYTPTAQKGLWFIGSGLSQARIWSHFIALQIKAREIGIVS
jgi:hypothetical protein